MFCEVRNEANLMSQAQFVVRLERLRNLGNLVNLGRHYHTRCYGQ